MSHRDDPWHGDPWGNHEAPLHGVLELDDYITPGSIRVKDNCIYADTSQLQVPLIGRVVALRRMCGENELEVVNVTNRDDKRVLVMKPLNGLTVFEALSESAYRPKEIEPATHEEVEGFWEQAKLRLA